MNWLPVFAVPGGDEGLAQALDFCRRKEDRKIDAWMIMETLSTPSRIVLWRPAGKLAKTFLAIVRLVAGFLTANHS